MKERRRSDWQQPFYEREYHQSVHGRLIDDPLYYELKAREAKADLFRGIDSSAEVFEFGVGLGKNIALLEHKSGYDISEFARTFSAQHGIQVFSDMGAVPDGKFDVVLSSHVLEHVDSPLDNLRLLATKLKPGGKLILVVPVELHRKVPFAIDADQHLYAWNFRTINNLLQRAGYQILENRYRYGTLQYKLRYVGKLSFRLYRLHTKLIGRLLRRRDMIVIAEKA
jgi:SAM-dependent methyltransferase